MSDQKKEDNILGAFQHLGMVLEESGDQARGDCPFCDKEGHFYLNLKTGQWDCKRCGEAGNQITFFTKYCDQLFEETQPEKWRELARDRGIPHTAFRKHRVAWSEGTSEWILPVFSEKKTVRTVGHWSGGQIFNNTGCPIQLYGLEELANAPVGSEVWLCEGFWDRIAMRWLLDEAGCADHIVVAVPGAAIFKQDWVRWFRGMNVHACYDNDDAGDRGSKKGESVIGGIVESIDFLSWPEIRPTGWDLRDQIKRGRGRNTDPIKMLAQIRALLQKRHRRDVTSPSATNQDAEANRGTPATFNDVLKAFKKWVTVDQNFEDALAVSLATCLANDVPGDPLFVYLVGPPGGGKTLILLALQDSDRTMFYSTLTPASLVSGFNVHPDPSLLPKLDGKAAVFKDGTELLAMHPDARREVYGVLRGAFDGHVLKPFGNGITREYHLHFNMLIGVTPAIHGDSQATMGERFLKVELTEGDVEVKIRSALDNISKEVEMQKELADVCKRFLWKQIDPKKMPGIPSRFVDKIVALARLVSVLRAQVDREAFGDREVKYRPGHEVGTRVGKQLAKLAQVLTYVFDVPEVNDRIYGLVERVGFNTTIGYHLDLLRALMPDKEYGRTTTEICQLAKIPVTTGVRRLIDMEHLRVISTAEGDPATVSKVGPRPRRYRLSPEVRQLWERATGQPPTNGKYVLKPVSAPSPARGAVAPAVEKKRS